MEYSFNAFGIDMFTVTGPDPFSSDTSRNSSSLDQSTLTLRPDADLSTIYMTDNETNLHDGDSDQELTRSVLINGQSFGPGTDVEIEYSYLLMPVGSSNGADAVTVYVLEFNSDVQGVAVVGTMQRGVTYLIVQGGSDDPSVSYDQLPICFARGTRLETVTGPKPVESLRAGDLVQTADNGWQPVRWVVGEGASGRGAQAPVRIAAGALGNAQALVLSPQHRVLVPALGGALVPAKALVGWPGIRRAEVPRVEWWHLLLDRHEVVFANALATETLLPGPQVWQSLRPVAQASLARVWDRADSMAPARRLIAPGRFARLGLQNGRFCPSHAAP